VKKRVLLAAIDGEVVIAALAGIHKLQVDVLADALKIAIVPGFKREGRSAAAAFVLGTLVLAAGGVRIDVVRRSKGDVDVTAVGLPAWLAGRKVLVA
jgi:hypothetical protein